MKKSPIQKGSFYAVVNGIRLQNRDTERKAAIDGENYAAKNGFKKWEVYPYDYIQYEFEAPKNTMEAVLSKPIIK